MSLMSDQIKERALFETSPILRAIFKLAFPTVIGQIILVIYNMADTFFIGLTNNDSMLTAVTVCMPAFMFLSAISNLFGVGGSSVISRALGRNNVSRAKRTAAFALWGCIAVTVAYSLAALALRHPFLNLLGADNPEHPEMHDYAVSYLMVTVVLGGIGTTMNTLLGHLVRSEGRSVHASVGIAFGGVMNIALDPLFMYVLLRPGQEVLGAAIATALSNFLSMVYFIVIIASTRKKSVLRFRPSWEMFQNGIVRDVLSTGLPACLMTLCENISYAVLDKLISLYRVISMQSGIGVAKKVNMLAHCMVRGMSQGVLPLIGYNYASGNHKRMRQAVLISMGISVGLATLCMIAALTLARPLISVFTDSEPTIACGAAFLRILCIGGPFSACAYAFISFFQATGQGLKSFILAILRKGVLDIPMMLMLNALVHHEGRDVVWATPIADFICCIVSISLFVGFIHRQTNLFDDVAPELD